ncbi:unnamed protein product [Rotaria magnacalcarata]
MILHKAISLPQINLYLTDSINETDSDIALQHNCLYLTIPTENKNDTRQIMFYCLSESPLKWNIKKNGLDQIFTFETLYRQGVTSLELYTWSAPMDIVERYEYYTKHVTMPNITAMGTQLFYNCTEPRFGPSCQYSLNDYEPYHSSLNEIIDHSFSQRSEFTTLTCYTHMQCNRGIPMVCLDWSEICDGKVDCIDGGRDEEGCWELEINECEKDEYRCANGQCIPDRLFRDDITIPDCLDASDEATAMIVTSEKCITSQPTFLCEDIVCTSSNQEGGKRFSSSCMLSRNDIIFKAVVSEKSNSIKDICWSTFLCIIHVKNIFSPECLHCFYENTCEKIIEESCPYLTLIPDGPIFFGNIYFGYINNESTFSGIHASKPQYICYKEPVCQQLFENTSSLSFNNLTCQRPPPFAIPFFAGPDIWYYNILVPGFRFFWGCSPTATTGSTLCNEPNLYQCSNSTKCISKYRLHDYIVDCYYDDDERVAPDNGTCMDGNYFKCKSKNTCIRNRFVADDICHCPVEDTSLCEDESLDIYAAQYDISFQTICDGFTELLPIDIDGLNETEETNCVEYPCNNTYTRCDGIWNCFNGADEVDCEPSPLIQCSRHHHICVLPDTNQLTCLPITKANDGTIDCLGATDEPKFCRSLPLYNMDNKFYCRNDTTNICLTPFHLCDPYLNCTFGDDEQFCPNESSSLSPDTLDVDGYKLSNSSILQFFRKRFTDTPKRHIVHFLLGKEPKATDETKENDRRIILTSSATTRTSVKRKQRCYRGLELTVWLDTEKNLTENTCLCPPSFYGDQCQYQNQRVSLTLTFAAFPDSWRIPFLFLILLIDNSDERTIHSYEQLTYLPMQDCKIKFNLYLFYAIRPKKPDPTQYSIHIDIFEKISLKYRGSWLLLLNYSFLPVHRIAVQLTIPRSNSDFESCADTNCINGRCVRYSNSLHDTTFCRCHRGWSGRFCTIPFTCSCSADSLCIAKTVNQRSVCVCSVEKFGSRCLLDNVACQKDQFKTCQNGGQCMLTNEYGEVKTNFICICPKGFSGDRCEITDPQIIVTFHKDIRLPESMLLHFIQVVNDNQPNIATTFKTIPIWDRTVNMFWSRPFHLVFVQLKMDYYLSFIQNTYDRSKTYMKTIESSDRCKHIGEIFDQTIVQSHMLRRIKLYHVPCRNRSAHLSCFYDETHLCICDYFGDQRLANCFKFDHQMRLDCFGQNECQNGGQCFQDNRVCPQVSICVCPRCYYGVRCQFSTHGFSLSLDAILSYHIKPRANIRKQPLAVQVSIALSIVMASIGLVNGILSLITFQNKAVLKVSCGFYLLCSSITTLIGFIIWTIKFWILLLTQMGSISNQPFLFVQCVLMDFFLRICLNMDQWLNACVAADRALVTLKGTSFNQKKSKKMAKRIVVGLLVLTIITTIQDPIHRNLINDENEDEKRIWCTLNYSPYFKKFDSLMNTVHFSIPFLVNLLSAIFIIINTAKKRTNARANVSYKRTLYLQFRQHYNLVVAPCILVIIALPRLILSFVSGCMNTARESWIFLIGYFISFIAPMLSFIIYIVPSQTYREEFRKTIARYKRLLLSCRDRFIE